MQTRFHGVTSIGFILLAVLLAVFFAWQLNIILALGYLLFVLFAFAVVITAYCAKCPCKGRCAHVIPGWLAQQIDRQPGPYTRLEIGLLIVALGLMLLLPNVWLISTPIWLGVYWLLIIIGIVQIRGFVCKPCGNIFCPLNQNKK